MVQNEERLYSKAEETLVSMFAAAHGEPTATWETIQDNLENIDVLRLLQSLKLAIDGKSNSAHRVIEEFFGNNEAAMKVFDSAKLNENLYKQNIIPESPALH